MKSLLPRYLLAAPVVLLIVLVALLIMLPGFQHLISPAQTVHAQSSNLGALSGYAWSDNFGWISFSGSNYQVVVQSDGTLAGYAWANPSDDADGTNNIGWIDFNAADTSGCGFGAATLTGTSISGGALVISADNNGWNGCIDLSGTSPTYGVTLNSTGSSQSGTLDGYAWADSTVGGWISFNCDTGGPTDTNPNTNICSTSNYSVLYTTGYVPPPTSNISKFYGSPSRVKNNTASTLYYNVTVTASTTCSIAGSDGSSYPTITTDGTLHSITTNDIVKNTLYTMTCGTVSASTNIGVLPTYQEL